MSPGEVMSQAKAVAAGTKMAMRPLTPTRRKFAASRVTPKRSSTLNWWGGTFRQVVSPGEDRASSMLEEI